MHRWLNRSPSLYYLLHQRPFLLNPVSPGFPPHIQPQPVPTYSMSITNTIENSRQPDSLYLYSGCRAGMDAEVLDALRCFEPE